MINLNANNKNECIELITWFSVGNINRSLPQITGKHLEICRNKLTHLESVKKTNSDICGD